jgi:exosortase
VEPPRTGRQTIVRNTVWYGVVTVVGLVAGLLMSVVLARGLGPTAMGDYSYLLWVVRVLTAVATLGFALAATRYTADALARGDRQRAGAYLGYFVRRQVRVTAAVVVGLLPAALLLAPADLRWPLVVLALGLFPVTLEAVYAHAAYGAQRYDLTTQVSTVKMVLYLVAAVGAIGLGGGILGLVIGSTLGTVVSCALQRRQALALFPERDGALPPAARTELRGYLVPLSIVAVLDTVVWDRSEVLFLRWYAGSAEIAFYSVAFGLATRAMVAPQVVAGALLPALASLHGLGARAEFRRVYREALRLTALVGAPLAAVGTAVAPGLVETLYGADYAPVAALLGPLLAVALIGVMRQTAWAALRASGDRHWALHATWVSAVVNVVLAALLIPRHGVWGAVAANAAAQGLASALAFVAVGTRRGCGFPLVALARIAAAAAVSVVVSRIVTGDGGHPARVVAGLVAGLAAFGLTALAVRAIGAREWRLLAMALPAVSRRHLALGGAAAAGIALAALTGPVLWDLARVWATVPYYSYGFLVPLFSAWIAWEARDRLRGARPAWSPPGGGLLLAGLALLGAGVAGHSLTLRALALPVVAAGVAWLAVGRARLGVLAFPLAFLVFMAPLPDAAVQAVSLPLQHFAAWFTGGALSALGVPSVREGLFIHLPELSLHVTEACNGLRFLLAMLVIGTAFAWRTVSPPGRRLATVGLAVSLGIAANLLRVTGTGWLAYHYGPEAASGFFHVAYGKVVYAAMLAPFVLGVLWLRRWRLPEPRHGA